MAAGTAHPLNQTRHLDDRFQAESVASCRPHRGSQQDIPQRGSRFPAGYTQGTRWIPLTLLHLPIQLAPIRPVFLIWTAEMAAIKVAKLMGKGCVLLLAGLVGIEQQLKAHWNGFALLFEGRAFRQNGTRPWYSLAGLTGVLEAEFALVDSNAIPLCILNCFVEFAVLFSTMNREGIGNGRRKFRGVAQGVVSADIENEENRPLGLQDCDGLAPG